MSAHTCNVLWIDHDAADFRPVFWFAKRAGITLHIAPTLWIAYQYLRDENLSFDAIILDALVPFGGQRGETLLLSNTTRNDESLQITGHLLLNAVPKVGDGPIRKQLMVLSVLPKAELVSAGFPQDLMGFFEKARLDEQDHWLHFRQTLCDISGAAMPPDTG